MTQNNKLVEVPGLRGAMRSDSVGSVSYVTTSRATGLPSCTATSRPAGLWCTII